MDLSVSSTEGAPTVVTVDGEIDVYTAPQLRDSLDRLIDSGHPHLVIDLERVGFLDSTGLGVLVGRLKHVRVLDGSLALVCTQDRILKVFTITGLDKVFRIFDSVDAALAAQ
ncbi:STAS domain-containing protein [Actinomycetota bacterium]